MGRSWMDGWIESNPLQEERRAIGSIFSSQRKLHRMGMYDTSY